MSTAAVFDASLIEAAIVESIHAVDAVSKHAAVAEP